MAIEMPSYHLAHCIQSKFRKVNASVQLLLCLLLIMHNHRYIHINTGVMEARGITRLPPQELELQAVASHLP